MDLEIENLEEKENMDVKTKEDPKWVESSLEVGQEEAEVVIEKKKEDLMIEFELCRSFVLLKSARYLQEYFTGLINYLTH